MSHNPSYVSRNALAQKPSVYLKSVSRYILNILLMLLKLNELVVLLRFELRTFGFSDQRSYQLSYSTI